MKTARVAEFQQCQDTTNGVEWIRRGVRQGPRLDEDADLKLERISAFYNEVHRTIKTHVPGKTTIRCDFSVKKVASQIVAARCRT